MSSAADVLSAHAEIKWLLHRNFAVTEGAEILEFRRAAKEGFSA
jgi:hypothetical protein